jgi:ribosome-associated heat shock protein Hsp15
MEEGVRIDKWLWAVRIYKTRSQSTTACKSGKIKINGSPVKPSHEVKPGETIMVNLSPLHKTIKVTGLIYNRVSAKLAVNYIEDLTLKEEYDKLKMGKEVNFEYRQRGIGRPTKRARREIEILKKYLGD